MKGNSLGPPPVDAERQAHAALDELLRRLFSFRPTGTMTLTLNVNQGGITAIRIGTEETFK